MTEARVMVKADDANRRAAAYRTRHLSGPLRAESAAKLNRDASLVNQVDRRRAGILRPSVVGVPT